MSQRTVSRVWRAFALQPHRSETFKLSREPLFIEKVRDIVGLYLHPPDKALILCVDEIEPAHVGESVQYRVLDRSASRMGNVWLQRPRDVAIRCTSTDSSIAAWHEAVRRDSERGRCFFRVAIVMEKVPRGPRGGLDR